MTRTSRRSFLKLAGSGAATAASLGVLGSARAQDNPAPAGRVNLPYPDSRIANLRELKENTPQAFHYPDSSSPCQLIKLGHAVPGGVGPDGDIVAYSSQCTHMGCPLEYDTASRNFKCGCHFSVFDSEKAGQMVTGQATENLPRILLRLTENGDIHAVSVEGLIYGRQSNLLGGAS
ncbi:arsenate reductase (azurin) small subunit [Marinobacterium sp. D7]|uniref:arsenate reductase (azurin) small subunit n=1 Tax=Marinobacterium ramblicola TaxID=2849041 RepID=UPI001C2D1D81|nr:arsenate reductase (azurin) small subunit [Marinobacterium ramblicola]MBV1790259.1 arsenate reductase (azurin) small subunit [Marinobacterium ramblicola]